MSKVLRVIISGGGTGGHIFPAISIANAICPDACILFVGAQGRMEMQRVPAAGYEIKGLPIRGFFRPLWKPANIGVAIDYLKSKWMAKKLLREFRPDVAVGVGGYASAAALGAANSLGIPTLIQEQNSYAGLANKNLAKKAEKICVAYEGMERFFPAEKIILTGNPVRQNLLDTKLSREEAVKSMGFDASKKTILLVGGSLGARTINESVLQHLDLVKRVSGTRLRVGDLLAGIEHQVDRRLAEPLRPVFVHEIALFLCEHLLDLFDDLGLGSLGVPLGLLSFVDEL